MEGCRVGDLGDPIAGLLDTGGDRVSGGDPLPRGDSPIGIQSGQLIEAALVSVQLGGQVSNVVIQAGSPGHGVGEVPGIRPDQYRVGHQLFDGFSDHGTGGWFPEAPQRVLNDHKDEPAAVICDRLRESLLGHAPAQDDVTLVVIKYTPEAFLARSGQPGRV